MASNTPHDGDDGDDGSTRLGRDTPASGTHSGADVTSRMTGARDHDDHDGHDGHDGHDERVDTDHTDRVGGEHARTTSDERYEERVVPTKYKTAKTSAAAAFALVFGLAALFSALTAILAPAAVLFGLIGIVLGIAGLKMSKKLGVTGKGVAIGGLVTAILGLLLGGAVLAGAAVYVNDEQRLDQLESWIDDARTDIPSGSEIVEEIPGN